MTKTEIKDKARHKRDLAQLQALKGLSSKQKLYVKQYDPTKPVSELARKAGYSETTSTHRIYDMIKSPRLQRAIELYHGIQDEGVGILSVGTVVDIQTDEEATRDERLQAAKLGLQVAGKLKQVNLNQNMNINVDLSADDLASAFNIIPVHPTEDVQNNPETQ